MVDVDVGVGVVLLVGVVIAQILPELFDLLVVEWRGDEGDRLCQLLDYALGGFVEIGSLVLPGL